MFGVHPWQGASRVCSSSQQVTAALGPVVPAPPAAASQGLPELPGDPAPQEPRQPLLLHPSQAVQVVFLC